MTRRLPEGSSMITIDVAAPFLIPLKLALLLSIVVTAPWIYHQVWAFVAPDLCQNERPVPFPALVSSTLLFYAGMAFAYYVMFLLAFRFLLGTAPEGVEVMIDIACYLDLAILIFLALDRVSGSCVHHRVGNARGRESAESNRKATHVIVGALVFGAF